MRNRQTNRQKGEIEVTEISEQTAQEAARQIVGATIAWGDGRYYDLETPNPEIITIEDYAYALAYTCRWRGQTRNRWGQRAFYGVGQHVITMAYHLLADGHGKTNALAGLYHESDEVPFPDWLGPGKKLVPGLDELTKRHGVAIKARFGIETPDPDLIKQYDIRMLVTEKRDLMRSPRDTFTIDGVLSTEGYEPFDQMIVPWWHPDVAGEKFMRCLAELTS